MNPVRVLQNAIGGSIKVIVMFKKLKNNINKNSNG